MGQRILCLVLLTSLAGAGAVTAQTPRPLGPPDDGVDCGQFIQADPGELYANARGASLWSDDRVGQFVGCLARRADIARGITSDAGVNHDRILAEFIAFRHVKHWYRDFVDAYKATKPQSPANGAAKADLFADMRRRFEDYDSQINAALTQHGLQQPFSGVLKAGAAFLARGGTAGGGSAGAEASTDSSQSGTVSQLAVAHIDFETKHFGSDLGTPVDISFGATFGFQPALSFIEPTKKIDGTATDAKPSTVYQNAFVFSGSTNVHVSTFHAGELGISGRLGVVNLMESIDIVDRGKDSYIAVPFGGDATRLFGEVGIKSVLYTQGIALAHLEKASLMPLLSAEAGFRKDPRFTPAGSTYTNPADRVYIRVSADNVPIFRSDDDRSSGAKPFSVAFAWEYEAPAFWGSGQKIPSGNRFVIRGDVNLLRALKGEPAADKEQKAGTP